MKLELLSPNLIQIIDKCVNDKNLARLLYYNTNNPLSPDKEDVKPSLIAPFGEKERILPYPFDITFTDEQRSQLHVYYPEMAFKSNEHVEQTLVWFDIVVHRRLWLFMQDSDKLVRPYEVAKCIGRLFDDKMPQPKNTVGKLNFNAMAHVPVNEEFNCIRIEAMMTTF